MSKRLFLAACVAALAASFAPKALAQSDFKSWPKGSSPREIGKRVAERFAASPHFNFMRPTPPPKPLLRWDCPTRGPARAKSRSRRNRIC